MTRRGAFTLIELVVVILILGILAAVAAPRLLTTSASATDNGLKQSLSIIRDAIELYAADQGGALPPCTADGADFRAGIAPYIRGDFPICPVGPAQNNEIEPADGGGTLNGIGAPTRGWAYHVDTGKFICNYNAFTASDPTVRYDDL